MPRARRVQIFAPDADPAQDIPTPGQDNTRTGQAFLSDFRLTLREFSSG